MRTQSRVTKTKSPGLWLGPLKNDSKQSKTLEQVSEYKGSTKIQTNVGHES